MTAADTFVRPFASITAAFKMHLPPADLTAETNLASTVERASTTVTEPSPSASQSNAAAYAASVQVPTTKSRPGLTP